MRLIDVDTIAEEFAKAVPYTIESEAEQAYDSGLIMGYSIVQNAPTVDAIPTKWLEEYIDNLSNEIEHYEIAGVGCGGARKQLEGVEIMLQHWREENEQSNISD